MTNPYEADPQKVPQADTYLARSPYYGRYHPQPDDFTPKSDTWYDSDTNAVAYWKDVIEKHCHAKNSLNERGSREAFAVGKVIIRIDQEQLNDASIAEKYSCLNANEFCAARKVEDVLKAIGVAVPVILFSGTIEGKNVTVESRIPGVSLEVAWTYLSDQQKQDFKEQCRRIVQRIATSEPPSTSPSYVCSGLNTQTSTDVSETERSILFADKSDDEELCLVHNASTRNNIIVKDNRVVGIIGWRSSGYFGLPRAHQVHRDIRIGQETDALGAAKDNFWADLYSSPLEGIQEWPNAGQSTPRVKTELPTLNLENLPVGSPAEGTPVSLGGFWDGTDDQLPAQPKQVSDLKRGSISRASFSRASSSERSSPAPPSKLGPGVKKGSAASTKKGTASKKPPAKKLKVDTADAESLNGTRSATPASARGTKTPGVKKQGSTSAATSPAPEPKKKPGKKATPAKKKPEEEIEPEDSDVEDENEVFCICRKPDNHTWMIGCDGGCEDWFHGKCVNIDPRDSDLIDKYICPNCKAAGKGTTTWKPMCRLKTCRKPARVTGERPSKYCSDEHGIEFMRYMTRHLNLKPTPSISSPAPSSLQIPRARSKVNKPPVKGNMRDSHSVDGGDTDSIMEDATNDEDDEEDPWKDEDLGSRGGVLTAADLKAAVMGVSSAEEFRRLGDRLFTPPPEIEETPLEVKAEVDLKPTQQLLHPEINGKGKGKAKPSGKANKKTAKKDAKKEATQTNATTITTKPKNTKKIGLDVHPQNLTYSLDEDVTLQKLRKQRDSLVHRREMLAARNTFIGLIKQRGKNILDRLKQMEPKGGWKDICGFDTRLSWNDDEFDEWRLSEDGKKMLERGALESVDPPRSSNTAATSGGASGPVITTTDPDGDSHMADIDEDAAGAAKGEGDGDDEDESGYAFARGVCLKKRCERHKQWVKVHQQDVQFEEAMLQQDLEKCERKAQAVVERAVLRMWAEKDGT